jgi:hypothetical protein
MSVCSQIYSRKFSPPEHKADIYARIRKHARRTSHTRSKAHKRVPSTTRLQPSIPSRDACM